MQITVRNVNEALPLAMMMFDKSTANILHTAPRGMATLEWDEPVFTCYNSPMECVLFDAQRDANPFFHLFEAMWILAGRRDVKFLAHFLPRIADFSDNGDTFHAPYGYRLRRLYGDQLTTVANMLATDHDTRRAVCSIWDAPQDLAATSGDIPCNDLLVFRVRRERLDMTVYNRSNDVILGAYGANAVQFSFILQWVAAAAGLPIGRYFQVSNSFHVYDNAQYAKLSNMRPGPDARDPYDLDEVEPMRFGDPFRLDMDLSKWFQAYTGGHDPSKLSSYQSDWVNEVLCPAWQVFAAYKRKDYDSALYGTKLVAAQDWALAMRQWVERRVK